MSYLIMETNNPALTYECPICLDPIIDNKYITFQVCNHTFHLDCINDWTKKTHPNLILSYNCPTCDCLRDIDINNSVIEIDLSPSINIKKKPLLRKIIDCFRKN